MPDAQEDVERQAIQFVIKTSKVTAKTLLKGIGWCIKKHKQHSTQGKQSVKNLIRQGAGVSTLDLGDASLRDFKKIANKYGVDFAITKDKTTDPPRYTVFFKARDADALTMVMTECTKRQLDREAAEEKPSIIEKLNDFKEQIAGLPRRVVEKKKEAVR